MPIPKCDEIIGGRYNDQIIDKMGQQQNINKSTTDELI